MSKETKEVSVFEYFLRVIGEFDSYKKGDLIKDKKEIEKVLKEHASFVVKVAV